MTIKRKKKNENYEPIYFMEEDFGDIDHYHDNSMVMLTLVHNFMFQWMFINQGNFTNIL